MKIGLDTPILDPVDPQLKHQIRALDLHMQLEIQVVELDAFCRRQPREERLGHRMQISRQRADVDEILSESVGSLVVFAAD